MSGGRDPWTLPMPAPLAAVLAAGAAGVLGTLLFCYSTANLTAEMILHLTPFAVLIALAHAGLVALPLGRVLIGQRPLDWVRAILTGVLTGVLPTIVFLGIGLVRHAFAGQLVVLDEWVVALEILAIGGCAAGLLFRALAGPRILFRKAG